MEEISWNATAVKDWLVEYREKDRDIDNQIERLERLVSKMTAAGAQVISDMPRSSGSVGDRLGVLVAQKEDLELSIRAAVESQSQKRRKIEAILSTLRHSDEKAVIRIRYIDRESWNTVAELMFGSREDYDEKEDTYLRRVHKVHGAALQNMAAAMNGDPNMPAPAV